MAAPHRLRLLGRVSQDELIEIYQRAGLCVFPSFVEAFGLACAEAMSCGAPVAASRLAAGAEIVEHGRSGLLIDPRDPAGMAETMLHILAEPQLGRALGEQARRRVVERYPIRLTAERTLALYEDALQARETWRKSRVA
jgi:glycosyltransferase involved in cell wall biosynthesis